MNEAGAEVAALHARLDALSLKLQPLLKADFGSGRCVADDLAARDSQHPKATGENSKPCWAGEGTVLDGVQHATVFLHANTSSIEAEMQRRGVGKEDKEGKEVEEDKSAGHVPEALDLEKPHAIYDVLKVLKYTVSLSDEEAERCFGVAWKTLSVLATRYSKGECVFSNGESRNDLVHKAAWEVLHLLGATEIKLDWKSLSPIAEALLLQPRSVQASWVAKIVTAGLKLLPRRSWRILSVDQLKRLWVRFLEDLLREPRPMSEDDIMASDVLSIIVDVLRQQRVSGEEELEFARFCMIHSAEMLLLPDPTLYGHILRRESARVWYIYILSECFAYPKLTEEAVTNPLLMRCLISCWTAAPDDEDQAWMQWKAGACLCNLLSFSSPVAHAVLDAGLLPAVVTVLQRKTSRTGAAAGVLCDAWLAVCNTILTSEDACEQFRVYADDITAVFREDIKAVMSEPLREELGALCTILIRNVPSLQEVFLTPATMVTLASWPECKALV